MEVEKLTNKIIQGDAFKTLKKIPSSSIDCVVTSPPYWGLRKYIDDGLPEKKFEIGSEPVFDCGGNCGKCFMCHVMMVMKEVKRVLKPTGTCWINFGDSYGGQPAGNQRVKRFVYATDSERMFSGKSNQNRLKHTAGEKCLLLQPERFAIRCVDELGLILRNKIVWAKQVLKFNKDGSKHTIGSAMPTSVKTRFNESYEFLYFFVKNNKTILWRNRKTKEWTDKKPPGINGVEGKDWEFQECFDNKPDCRKCQGTGLKKVSLWQGYGYLCDLDAVRIPHQVVGVSDMRPSGILRQRFYSESKYNKFNYRVRDAVRQEKETASQIAIKYGYNPEELCPICGRSWKRHASPNASDRKAGIRREFIPCVKNDPHRAVLKKGFKSLEERMKDTKNKDTKSSRAYNIKKLLSEVRLGIKPNIGMILNKVNDPRGNRFGGPGSWRDFKDENKCFTHLFGKNIPTCWQINPQPHTFSKELGLDGIEHFSCFPENLCTIPILFGSPEDGIILDPFAGSFTTCLVAEKLGRKWIGIELNKDYCKLGQARIAKWRKGNKKGSDNNSKENLQPPIVKLE